VTDISCEFIFQEGLYPGGFMSDPGRGYVRVVRGVYVRGGVNVTKQNVPIRGAILVRHFGVNNVYISTSSEVRH